MRATGVQNPCFVCGINGFGTLYTALYRPRQRQVESHWPGLTWAQSLDAFREGEIVLDYATL